MKKVCYGYIWACELPHMKEWGIPLIQWYHRPISGGYKIEFYTPCSEKWRSRYCACQMDKKKKDRLVKNNCKLLKVKFTAEIQL